MKNGNTVGKYEIPVMVWKVLCKEGRNYLCDLMRKIVEQEKVMIPMQKGKVDVQDCSKW